MRTAIITGGTGGLGAAVTKRFLDDGWRTVVPWVHEGEIQIRWVTQLALSFDHRLVDGELGARLLFDVGRVMNDPAHGLVWA